MISLNQLNWKNYIKYFGNKENEQPLFSTYHVNAKERYDAVMEYMKQVYDVELYRYLVNENVHVKTNKVTSFDLLPKYNFQLARDGITISAFIKKLQDNAFILRPSYQRREINDIKSSSFLIESLILKMTIPDILVYRHEVDKKKTIFEVIDGQQRSFSILGFLKMRYKNFLGEEIASEKEGFSLTGLTLCADLNNKKVGINKNALNNAYIEKILNSKIRIVYIPDKDNPYFSVRDYFTSINKTIIPLKKTSYRYWRAFCDSKMIKVVEEIAEKFQTKILPRSDNKYLPQQYVMNLSYLFYHCKIDCNRFSVQCVARWLEEFNRKKYELINKLKDEEVEYLRKKYMTALEQVDQFLTNLANWLDTEGHTMNDLLSKRVKKITFTDLLSLYYLLWDVNSSDLINNSQRIYNIILEYFKNGIEQNLNRVEKINNLKKYKDRLSFISIQTIEMKQFREKVTNLLND